MRSTRRARSQIQPDLVWYATATDRRGRRQVQGREAAGYPNADIYQMLAYCTALGLPVGHLVYAKGNDAETSAVIRNAGIAIHCHTVELDTAPDALAAQVDELARDRDRSPTPGS